jgi:hypothetical protein
VLTIDKIYKILVDVTFSNICVSSLLLPLRQFLVYTYGHSLSDWLHPQSNHVTIYCDESVYYTKDKLFIKTNEEIVANAVKIW